MASQYNRDKLVCGHCSVVEHKQNVCPNRKKKTSKCVNCGLVFTAGH